MHDCQKLDEDLADLVLGGTALNPDSEWAAEIRSCEDCTRFYEDALTVVRIVESAEVQPPQLSEEYWAGFGSRLRSDLMKERRTLSFVRPRTYRMQSAILAMAAAVLIGMTLLIFQVMHPLINSSDAPPPKPQVQVIDGHLEGLDMATIDYLGQSEMFLRNFVKIEPMDVEDLEDARSRAKVQLVGLAERKEAAADFMPVEGVLDDYETILRDINNMEQPSPKDVTDIQDRIERNGLIATMKAYQPQIVVTEP